MRKTVYSGIFLILSAVCSSLLSTSAATATPPAEALWVANGGYISVFDDSALQSSGTPDASLVFSVRDYLLPLAIAINPRRNLWIANLSERKPNKAIFEVRHAKISHAGAKAVNPKLVTPVGPGVAGHSFIGLAFDSNGNLWIASGVGQIFELEPNQFGRRHPRPAIVIGPGPFFGAIRFDPSNNLWANASNTQLWRFPQNDRATPDLIVHLPPNFGIQDLAFDGSANLWVAGADFSTPSPGVEILMIPAAVLSGSGEITPPIATTITSAAFGSESGLPAGLCVGGIDFDQSGNLWASTACNPPALIAFTPGQQSTGGDLLPSITISPNSSKTNIGGPGPIRFGPAIN